MVTHDYALTDDNVAIICSALNYSLWNDREMTTKEHEITKQILDKLQQNLEPSF